MERDAFLRRVREAVPGAAPPPSGRPLADAEPAPVPRWPDDGRSDVDVFLDAVADHGGTGHRLTGPQDLDALLRDLVATHRIRTAVVTREAETGPVATPLRALGVRVDPSDDLQACAEADLGVTGAAWGFARTGTVVVDAARAGGRSASLLPRVHLALLAREHLLADPSSLWREVPQRYPAGPPSQLVHITGPSKSADIEGELTVGVHGPAAWWVGVLCRRPQPD